MGFQNVSKTPTRTNHLQLVCQRPIHLFAWLRSWRQEHFNSRNVVPSMNHQLSWIALIDPSVIWRQRCIKVPYLNIFEHIFSVAGSPDWGIGLGAQILAEGMESDGLNITPSNSIGGLWNANAPWWWWEAIELWVIFEDTRTVKVQHGTTIFSRQWKVLLSWWN